MCSPKTRTHKSVSRINKDSSKSSPAPIATKHLHHRGQTRLVKFKPNRRKHMQNLNQQQIQWRFVLILIYSMLKESQIGPLRLIRCPICWGDWQWTDKVKPQGNDWQKIEHWNKNSHIRRDRNTDQTGWKQFPTDRLSSVCHWVSLIHCEQYISHMYSVRTVDNLTLCLEFTTHREKQGRQKKDCARRASGTKSSKMGASATWPHRTYLLAQTQTDISRHRKRINEFVVCHEHLVLQLRCWIQTHSTWKQQLTWWVLSEDRQRLTAHWLHGEGVLARCGHRLIFYTLYHSQLFVQSERHL